MATLIYVLREGGLLVAQSELSALDLATQMNQGFFEVEPAVLELMGALRSELRAEVRGPLVLVMPAVGKVFKQDLTFRLSWYARKRNWKARLTARQMDVMQCLIEGLSDQQIGARLNMSERTVEYHIEQIKARLHATTRIQAVHRWLGIEDEGEEGK